jgi:hypothetical protein
MVEQILSNNNEKCYNNFSPTFHQLNAEAVTRPASQRGQLGPTPLPHISSHARTQQVAAQRGAQRARPDRVSGGLKSLEQRVALPKI